MNEKDFADILKEKNIVVVHFSHHAVMSKEVVFPDDLKHTILHCGTDVRSCCALYPGHQMNPPGSIGVIFQPKFSDIISVCNTDSGSSDYGGKEISQGKSPDYETIEWSLKTESGRYNEWRIKGARPIGIFVCDPCRISAKAQKVLYVNGLPQHVISAEPVTLQTVKDFFPAMNVYTMGVSGLQQL